MLTNDEADLTTKAHKVISRHFTYFYALVASIFMLLFAWPGTSTIKAVIMALLIVAVIVVLALPVSYPHHGGSLMDQFLEMLEWRLKYAARRLRLQVSHQTERERADAQPGRAGLSDGWRSEW